MKSVFQKYSSFKVTDERCLRDVSFGRSASFEMKKIWNLDSFEGEQRKIAEELNWCIDQETAHVMLIDLSDPYGEFRVPKTYANVDMVKCKNAFNARICFEI